MIGIRPEDSVIRRKSIKEENDNIILPGIIEKISYTAKDVFKMEKGIKNTWEGTEFEVKSSSTDNE